MTERDKVIKGLDYAWEYIRERPNPTAVPKAMAMDGIKKGIALLKEQEAVVRCKDCKWKYEDDGRSFCGYHSGWFPAEPDWFCADGVKKHD